MRGRSSQWTVLPLYLRGKKEAVNAPLSTGLMSFLTTTCAKARLASQCDGVSFFYRRAAIVWQHHDFSRELLPPSIFPPAPAPHQ